MQKLTDILAMGGYGAYVWPSYGIAALVLAGMAWASRRAHRQAQKTFAELQKTDEA